MRYRQTAITANRLFRACRTDHNRNVLLEKRRSFCRIKRKAKSEFRRNQKQNLAYLANNSPRSFWAELKNLKGKGSKENSIQPETFCEHFKELYSKGESFHDDNVKTHLQQNSEITAEHTRVWSNSITIAEVRNGIGKLKRNKSAGIDFLLIPEIFIVSKDIISPLLCKLLNYLYDNCLYPDSWSRGIVPVPKKGRHEKC